MTISQVTCKVREYYKSGLTRSYSFRYNSLLKLKASIIKNQDLIYKALEEDLGKSQSESYMAELGLVLEEISYTLRHLKGWMKKHKVSTPLAHFAASSYRLDEPYGVVLIISPWNYPILLSLSPLVGAIAAGNCVVLKPSSYAKATSAVIKKVISDAFDQDFISVIEGGRAENTALLEERFDYIFFTGSVSVGHVVMEAASKNLTPVTLELGGKSPVVVEKSANIKIAATRIAFGKILNSGQTCVAPDYLLIDESVKDEFICEYKKALKRFLSDDEMKNYPHIINEKHYLRLKGLMEGQQILAGGGFKDDTHHVMPALVQVNSLDNKLMKEEIFGPILPLLTYKNYSDIYPVINSFEKPLAFYLFTNDKKIEKETFNKCSFGGGCVNDTIIHLATSHMPFGGVGASGMGGYHGKDSYLTFTHSRSIVKKANWLDLPLRYHPYSALKEKLIKLFIK